MTGGQSCREWRVLPSSAIERAGNSSLNIFIDSFCEEVTACNCRFCGWKESRESPRLACDAVQFPLKMYDSYGAVSAPRTCSYAKKSCAMIWRKWESLEGSCRTGSPSRDLQKSGIDDIFLAIAALSSYIAMLFRKCHLATDWYILCST